MLYTHVDSHKSQCARDAKEQLLLCLRPHYACFCLEHIFLCTFFSSSLFSFPLVRKLPQKNKHTRLSMKNDVRVSVCMYDFLI